MRRRDQPRDSAVFVVVLTEPALYGGHRRPRRDGRRSLFRVFSKRRGVMRLLKCIRHLAIRRFARKLGPKLRSLYGKSRSYTPGQIRRALKESHLYLPLPWVHYAYAMYMLEQDFVQEFGELYDYGEIRDEISESWGRWSEISVAGDHWIGEELFDGGVEDGYGGDCGSGGADGGGD